MKYTLAELANQVKGRVHGDESLQLHGVATLTGATPGTISFLSNRQYSKYLHDTKASAVIVSEQDVADCPVAALVVSNVYLAYAQVAAIFNPVVEAKPGKHPSTVVGADCSIHPDASLGPNVVIGDGVVIGARAQIGPNCVIQDGCNIGTASRLVANITVCTGVTIGQRCLIHPGVVIGSDGFGIAPDSNEQGEQIWTKVPQVGGVQIGNDVEIGSNTTIDRGALEDTVIEDGVKLDNQIQIAHNVRIGAHTAIAGCVGIAGSTTIGSHCAIGGAAMIIGHLSICDQVQITAGTLVTKSIVEPGNYSSGIPALPNDEWRKNTARFRKLDELARKVNKLGKDAKAKTE